jgi:hypothetical protein
MQETTETSDGIQLGTHQELEHLSDEDVATVWSISQPGLHDCNHL